MMKFILFTFLFFNINNAFADGAIISTMELSALFSIVDYTIVANLIKKGDKKVTVKVLDTIVRKTSPYKKDQQVDLKYFEVKKPSFQKGMTKMAPLYKGQLKLTELKGEQKYIFIPRFSDASQFFAIEYSKENEEKIKKYFVEIKSINDYEDDYE